MKKTVIIALGGSLIVPAPGQIDTAFLNRFKIFILRLLKTGKYRFIIIVGGGKTCRIYQKAAMEIDKNLTYNEIDLLGIEATKLNACLLKTIFRKNAYPKIIDNPKIKLNFKWSLIIASGWKPGWSTDYVAACFADRFNTSEIIDAGNVSHVYNKDPLRYRDAKIIKKMTWKKYRKIISNKWIPGLSAPIDPVAAKISQKMKLRTRIVLGTDLKNIENILINKPFRGTIIES